MSTPATDLVNLIEEAKTIGVITHVQSDADAFGSMLGLARILETLGKEVVVFSSEPLNYMFDFIRNEISYNPKDHYVPVDLLIGLDANTVKRFSIPAVFQQAKIEGKKLAVIDHHLVSDIGESVDVYWANPDASSASELVFHLAQKLHLKLDKTTATLILLGIEADTFSFQFENTRPKVFLAVAELLKQGARLKPVVEAAFGGKPLPMTKLLGRAIERVKVTKSGVAISYVTNADKKELGLTDEAVSGVANFLDQIKEAKVVMALEEQSDGTVKVSLRSNNSVANVAKLASFFGGGGHKKAAAFKVPGKLSEFITQPEA